VIHRDGAGQSYVAAAIAQSHAFQVLKLTNLAEPGASITWVREIKNLNKKLLTPTVDTIIRKSNDQETTNSKDIRKLRQVLRDPVAKEISFPRMAPSSPRYRNLVQRRLPESGTGFSEISTS
jgi:hypothetical protein